MLDFNQYSEQANKTAVYPGQKSLEGLVYCTLGAAGEAGELANKVKKILRDDKISINALIDEVGDVLWYLNEIALELGVSLELIAQRNLQKLEDRIKRDVLRGTGDNR